MKKGVSFSYLSALTLLLYGNSIDYVTAANPASFFCIGSSARLGHAIEGLQPIRAGYGNNYSLQFPIFPLRTFPGQRNHFTPYVPTNHWGLFCFPRAPMIHSYDGLGPALLFSADVNNVNVANAIKTILGLPLNQGRNNFFMTIEDARGMYDENDLQHGYDLLFRPQWQYIQEYANHYGAAGGEEPGVYFTVRALLVDAQNVRSLNLSGNYQLHGDHGQFVSASPSYVGGIGVNDYNTSRCLIYSVQANASGIHAAINDVGIIFLYNPQDTESFIDLATGASYNDIVNNIPVGLRNVFNNLLTNVLLNQNLGALQQIWQPNPGNVLVAQNPEQRTVIRLRSRIQLSSQAQIQPQPQAQIQPQPQAQIQPQAQVQPQAQEVNLNHVHVQVPLAAQHQGGAVLDEAEIRRQAEARRQEDNDLINFMRRNANDALPNNARRLQDRQNALIRALLNVNTDEEVNAFLRNEHAATADEELAINMLALRPLIYSCQQMPQAYKNDINAVVRTTMPEIYNILGNMPKIREFFIKSTFGNIFSPHIFSRFLRKEVTKTQVLLAKIRELLGEEAFNTVDATESDENRIAMLDAQFDLGIGVNPAICDAERLILANFGPNERGKAAQLFENIVDLGAQGVNGDGQINVNNENIKLPQLMFPILNIRQDAIREINNALNQELTGQAWFNAEVRNLIQAASDRIYQNEQTLIPINAELAETRHQFERNNQEINEFLPHMQALWNALINEYRRGDLPQLRDHLTRGNFDARLTEAMEEARVLNAEIEIDREVNQIRGNLIAAVNNIIRLNERHTVVQHEITEGNEEITRIVTDALRNEGDYNAQIAIAANNAKRRMLAYLQALIETYNNFATALHAHMEKIVVNQQIEGDIAPADAGLDNVLAPSITEAIDEVMLSDNDLTLMFSRELFNNWVQNFGQYLIGFNAAVRGRPRDANGQIIGQLASADGQIVGQIIKVANGPVVAQLTNVDWQVIVQINANGQVTNANDGQVIGQVIRRGLLRKLADNHNANNPCPVVFIPGMTGIDGPYVSVHTRMCLAGFNHIQGLDQNHLLATSLLEQLYAINFMNIMRGNRHNQCTEAANAPNTPMYQTLLRDVANGLRNSAYVAQNDFANLARVTIQAENRNGHFSMAPLLQENILPRTVRNLVIAHDRVTQETADANLKYMYLYYILKTIYLARTGGAHLGNAWVIEGQRQVFPQQFVNGQAREIVGTAYNVVHYLLDNMNIGEVSENFRNMVYGNDEAIWHGDGDINDNTYRHFSYDVTSMYNQVREDRINAAGAFVSRNLAVFSLGQLYNTVEAEERLDVWLFNLIGAVTNRYAHCQNGRMEGTLLMFRSLFGHLNHEILRGLNLANLTPVIAYIAAHEFINKIITFSARRDLSTNDEEATYLAYALSALDGWYGIELTCPIHRWSSTPMLRANNAAAISNILGKGIRFAQWLLDGYERNEPAEENLQGFRRLFDDPRNMNAAAIDNLVSNANVNDDLKRVLLRAHCEVVWQMRNDHYDGDGNADYLEQVRNIVRQSMKPEFFVEYLAHHDNEGLLQILFDAYKRARPDMENVTFGAMTRIQKKQMVFDMFMQTGTFQLNANVH